MLYQALEKELQTNFPQLEFTSNDKEKLITENNKKITKITRTCIS